MNKTNTPTLDHVTLAVLQNGLNQVCNEMDLAFQRAAFSPVIAEAMAVSYTHLTLPTKA